jgi:hypothetical protein
MYTIRANKTIKVFLTLNYYSSIISSDDGGCSLVKLVRVLLGDNSRTGDKSSKLFSLFAARRLFDASDDTTSEHDVDDV